MAGDEIHEERLASAKGRQNGIWGNSAQLSIAWTLWCPWADDLRLVSPPAQIVWFSSKVHGYLILRIWPEYSGVLMACRLVRVLAPLTGV
jgi:hypothetical protein